MRIEFSQCFPSGLDYQPKLAIDWSYIDMKPNSVQQEKHNKVRARMGLKKVLDYGSYFRLNILIFSFELEMRLIFRDYMVEQ